MLELAGEVGTEERGLRGAPALKSDPAEDGADKLRECPLGETAVRGGGGIDVRRNSEAIGVRSLPYTVSVGLVAGAEIWRPGGDRLFVTNVKRAAIYSSSTGQGFHADFKLIIGLVSQHWPCRS